MKKLLLGFVLLLVSVGAQAQSGCYGDGCRYQSGGVRLGDQVYRVGTYRDGKLAIVRGISSSGSLVLRYASLGMIETNVPMHEIASARGCNNEGICVGQPVIRIGSYRDGHTARVVGIQRDDTVVIRYDRLSMVETGVSAEFEIACLD